MLIIHYRYQEAQQLKTELLTAKLAERSARDKYQDFMRTSSLYGVSVAITLLLDVLQARLKDRKKFLETLCVSSKKKLF